MAAQKWNLQDIRPAEPRKKRRPAPQPVRPLSPEDGNGGFKDSQDSLRRQPQEREDIPSIVITDGNKKGNYRLLVSIVLFVVIVGGAVFLSAILGKTELTVYPEFREPNINADFIAYPDKRSNALSYEIMTLESTQESQVTATGRVQVQEQATGVMEIMKSTPGAERLIKNTRFRSPEGYVFRIQESVVVPGAVTDENGNIVPGTIQAEVFADEVGEEYNLPGGTEFDVPGFEEGGFTALYEAISGQNPQAFTGGLDGPQFQIDEGERSTARQALQVELRDTLLARIENEKPADFIAFYGAVAITFNQLEPIQYGDNLVTIREQAILQIPLFEKTEFGSFIAEQAVATYEGNPVRVDDPEVFTFSYTSPTTSSSVIANATSLSFNLSGRPLLIWEYDSEKLKSDLAGLPKTAAMNVRDAYPGITGLRVHITPFWQRSFPEDPEEIIIIEELKQAEE